MKLFQIIIVLALGISIGYFIQWNNSSQLQEVKTNSEQDFNTEPHNPFTVISDQQYQRQLEDEIKDLREQLQELEKELTVLEKADGPTIDETEPKTAPGEKLTKEILIQVGVEEGIAEDILSRLSQHEYQLLEHHDRAKREGYLNSSRFAKERRELMKNAPSLREAIGTDAYDRYLYETEQYNRVTVTTVMQGSPASRLGVLKGDVILNYANEKVLTWRELRELTGKGEYGEYVNLNILRDGQQMNILIPRGPLGVKLGATTIDPQAEYNY
ncbi:MAG: PDZ domain-containing protein [Gammaproteobacteria bacterium]|nr:PDZ domain-containing protein [Gammaproteobacteria bacterium]